MVKIQSRRPCLFGSSNGKTFVSKTKNESSILSPFANKVFMNKLFKPGDLVAVNIRMFIILEYVPYADKTYDPNDHIVYTYDFNADTYQNIWESTLHCGTLLVDS